MRETLDLELLVAFVAVADTASFTTAASRTSTTKATISRSIARLEAALGAQLFHRTTRKVTLTAAGTALYERAAPHVVALRTLAGTLPESERALSGRLRITAPTDFGAIVLPDVINKFGLRYPDVRVEAHLTNEVVDLVEGRFDLAIRAAGSKLKTASLTVRKLASLSLATYAAPAYVARRGSPRELGEPEHEWAMFASVGRALSLPRSFAPRVTANDWFFLRDLLRGGRYVGVLPPYLGEPLVSGGELVRVLSPIRGNAPGLVLLYPSTPHVPRRITAFRDVLLETLRAYPLPA